MGQKVPVTRVIIFLPKYWKTALYCRISLQRSSARVCLWLPLFVCVCVCSVSVFVSGRPCVSLFAFACGSAISMSRRIHASDRRTHTTRQSKRHHTFSSPCYFLGSKNMKKQFFWSLDDHMKVFHRGKALRGATAPCEAASKYRRRTMTHL